MNKLKTIILLYVGTISGCGFSLGTPGHASYINKCDSSIEVHHNDGGGGRGFLLASGEDESFTGGGANYKFIPTYIREGKANEFYIESNSGGDHRLYTACHNEKNVK